MKKITLFIAFAFLFILKSNAQVSSYSFAQSNGSYSEFTDGTVLGTATGNATGTASLDNEVYTVTLPFSFIFNGSSFTSCNVSSNGFITFNTTAPAATLYTPISSTDAYSGSISAWGGNINALFDLGGLTGDMQWKEIGTAPNRELVVQYRNFRPTSSTSTTTAPYINFQIRLSETTNQIKFVYGSSGLAVGTTNSSTTKQIGLRGQTNTDFNNRTNATTVLFTASTAGTLNTNTQAYSSVNATPGVPSNGLTYTWTPPTCLAPLSTVVSNITTNTATISWSATAAVPSGGYEYYYSTSNVAPTGAGTPTSNLTENLTGLSDSSNYFLWMRSNCGSGDYSAWVGPISFVTLCPLVTSFSQNFDGVTTPNLPVCWSKIITNGASTFASVITTTTNSSAPNGVSLYNSDSPSTSNIMLVSPAVSNLSSGTHRIRFTGRNSTATQDIEIGTLSDPNDASTFTVLQTIDLSTTFAEYVVGFGTYSGSNTYIGFRRLSTSTYSYVYLDNISWEAIPAIVPNCSVVSTPANGSTNQNVATNLTWSANGNATGYKLSIGTTSGGTDILNNVDLGNVTSYNPTIDFAYNTLYYINLVAYNSTGDATGCTETSFTTSTPPPANDDSTGAIALTVNADLACAVTTNGTTIAAWTSTEAAPSCSATGINDDVWYMFTATNTAHRFVYSAVTTGTMATALYTGTPGSLVQLSGACLSGASQDFLGLTVGTSYYARVYTTSATVTLTTNFTVCLGTLPAAPANNEPSGAVVLTINPDVACSVTTTGTTISATASTEVAPSCNATGINDDVWYMFTATNTAHRFVYSAVTTGTIATALYTGTLGSLVQLPGACLSGTTLNFTGLTVGTLYYARVYTTTSTVTITTDFTVCLGVPPPAPVNDLITNASILTESTNETCNNGLVGTTDSATHSADYICNATDLDVWYTFTPSTTGIYNFNRTITAGTGTGYISVYSGVSGGLTRLNTSCTVNNFAQVLTAGTTYYISVASAATSTINFSLCAYLVPAAPANDLCANAITLTAGSVFATGAVVGSTAGATTVSGLTYACQAANRSEDVWYSVTVPTSGTLTVETKQVNGSPLLDTVLSVFSGTCGSLTEIGCNDDGGDGNHSIISLTGQTPGTTLYIGVWKYNASATGQFQVSAYDASLSTSGFDNNGFSAYPNPVKEVLNLSYTQNISDVAVYNLLGQQVIAKVINANQSQIDMSHLSSGAYMVKVTADNQVKMIKVIKE